MPHGLRRVARSLIFWHGARSARVSWRRKREVYSQLPLLPAAKIWSRGHDTPNALLSLRGGGASGLRWQQLRRFLGGVGGGSGSTRIVRSALLGNGVIALAKIAAAWHSGSSAMWAEAAHSVADCANQGLLLIGLGQARLSPSALHPYGYGKSVYVWSLVSALGTFWLGGGVSVVSSLTQFDSPSVDLDAVASWEVWSVLAISLCIDGYVLWNSIKHLHDSKPANKPFLRHVLGVRDPTVVAVLCEDGAACAGVIIAALGIAAARITGIPAFDAASGVAVGLLLGAVGVGLASLNAKYLIGSAVEAHTLDDIGRLIRSRPGVDDVHTVQSMWVGPTAFSYKCEIDFDGTWIAATLFDRYAPRFQADHHQNLPLLLSLYAEDVLRTVEKEVQQLEALVRLHHPQALFIEIEPNAGLSQQQPFALETHYFDPDARKAEVEVLDGFLEAARKEEDYMHSRRGYLDDHDEYDDEQHQQPKENPGGYQ